MRDDLMYSSFFPLFQTVDSLILSLNCIAKKSRNTWAVPIRVSMSVKCVHNSGLCIPHRHSAIALHFYFDDGTSTVFVCLSWFLGEFTPTPFGDQVSGTL